MAKGYVVQGADVRRGDRGGALRKDFPGEKGEQSPVAKEAASARDVARDGDGLGVASKRDALVLELRGQGGR